ncbi:hypothetical protein AgCh_030078 [Apium graveolens]
MDAPKTFNFSLVKGRLSEKQREEFYTEMKHVVVNVEIWVKATKKHKATFDCEGGGVLISPQGHILTLMDVILDPNDEDKIIEKLQVKTNDGESYPVKIISTTKNLGVAVLKIDSKDSETRFPYASICNDELKIGEEIYPIGHPGYLDFSFPVGHISFPCREYDELNNSLIQENADLELLKKRDISLVKFDLSHKSICYVDNLSSLRKLSSPVCFVTVNNVHGDGRGGARGMPFFNHRGEIIGMYFLLAYDQCFGIHAKTLYSVKQRI